jgi:uncharacterized protein (TIGR02996 family)
VKPLRTNPELERVILGDPLDPDAWLVYGDWLEEIGDPRGELVAVQARHARDPGNPGLLAAQRALFQRHGDSLLEGLHGFLAPKGRRGPLFRLSWEFGFIWTANVVSTGHTIDEFVRGLRALLAHPSARFIHVLALGAPPDNAWHRVVPVLAEAERPFRILFLGDSSTTTVDPRPAFAPLGDLSNLWRALPHLRCLELRGGAMNVGDLALPDLRELVIETSALQRATLRSIAGQSSWNHLEKLELWFGDRLCTCTLADLEPVFDGTSFPALRHLGIRNCAFVDRVCQALASAKLTRQLRVVDLSLGTLTEAGGHALLSARSAFANLAVLDLHHHYISRGTAAGIERLARFVDLSHGSRDPDEDGGSPQVWLDA